MHTYADTYTHACLATYRPSGLPACMDTNIYTTCTALPINPKFSIYII